MADSVEQRRKIPGWGAKKPECASVRKQDISHTQELGLGKQGCVYRAYVPLFGVCAVKYLLARNGPFVLQSEREAVRELVASLELAHHPNIVNFYGQVVEEVGGNVLGFFSEYMEGGCLKDVMISQISEHPDIWFKNATRWCTQIARALAFCHHQNVIHRDVKPENMLLSRDHLTIKLSDFGLARPSTDTPRNKTCNKGSFLYIAPEAIGDFGARLAYTSSCDVFSFGMFLFAVFNRSDPFVEFHEQRELIDPLRYKKMLVDGVRPRCSPYIPPEIVRIMEKCWQTDPERRPSMIQVNDELGNYWNGKYQGEVF